MPTWLDNSFMGSGQLYLDVFDNSTGLKTGELDMGNAIDFKLSAPKITKQEMKSRRTASYGNVVNSVITEYAQELTMTLADVTAKNLRFAFLGDNEDLTQEADDITNESVELFLGKWTKLANRKLKETDPITVTVVAAITATWQANHAYSLGAKIKPAGSAYYFECTTAGTSDATTEPTWGTVVGGTTADDGTLVWTCRKYTYTVSTDFDVDYDIGRIYAVEGGSIPNGATVYVAYSCDDLTGIQTNISTDKKITAFLRFVGKDKANNRDCELELFKVQISPASDVELISADKFVDLQLKGDILTTDDGAGLFLFKD